MQGLPAGLETDHQPPLVIPLRHFVVGLGFLVAAVVVGAGTAPASGSRLAATHLFLVGWVCVTIMGAMTQFVPVWSGVPLASRRAAAGQLWAVAVGVVGLAAGFRAGAPAWLAPAGVVTLSGLWLFVANMGRTLAAAWPLDVTERHFGIALACFWLVPLFGVGLAITSLSPTALPVPYHRLAGAHATLAVFGAVGATVIGALYQLVTMFTQVDPDRLDRGLRRLEEACYPAGVVGLAAGRLLGVTPVARLGGLAVAGGLGLVALGLARRLLRTSGDWTPMLARYAVAAVALLGWAVATLPAWARQPLHGTRLGARGTAPLLLAGVGFVVLGTLYHVVPFLVWVHRYSDDVGLADVPLVDDLYDDRLARIDFWCTVAGVTALVLAPVVPVRGLAAAGWALVLVGCLVVMANLYGVVRRHAPHSGPTLLFGLAGRTDAEPD